MTWKETDPVKERLKFVELCLKGRYEMSALCALFEISRKTGYKYIERFREGGREGLVDRSRAAHQHPNATPAEIAVRIIAAKRAHARWGPEKLLDYLLREEPDAAWPAVSTAGAILKREGLVKARRGRRVIAPPSRPPIDPITRPNQLQNLDYKGQFRTRDGRWCYPLTATDSWSRKLLVCQGFVGPTYENTRAALERSFREYGLPDAIRMDNGSPFVSTQSLGGLSRLGVWLSKLQITLIRTRPGSPQDNGLHERMHRTLKEETALPPAANLEAQQKRFDAFMVEYNEVRPHQALDGRSPSSLYTASTRSYPRRLATVEYPGHFETRAVRSDGTMKWKGQRFVIGLALAGERVGLEETVYGIWSIYFGTLMLGILDETDGVIIG
jgi:transposase InsO family protein